MPKSIALITLSPTAQTAFLKFRTNVYYSDWFSDFPRPYGDHNHYSFMYSIFANSIDKKRGGMLAASPSWLGIFNTKHYNRSTRFLHQRIANGTLNIKTHTHKRKPLLHCLFIRLRPIVYITLK